MFPHVHERKMLLADGNDADAKTAAFKQEFGTPDIRLMCYFHMLHNCEKYLKPLENCEERRLLKN